MQRHTLRLLILAAGLSLAVVQAGAHHSLVAEFDATKDVELTGVVTKIEWTNPHAYFYIDAANPTSGRIEMWAWELGSPNGLMRQGWTRDSMKVGDIVTVVGTLSKDGSNKVNTRSVLLPDGHRLSAASNEAGVP